MKTEHFRSVYTMVDLLAQIGGLFTGLATILGVVMRKINRDFFATKLARNMYIIK